MVGRYKHWKYKNTFFLVCTLIFLFYLTSQGHLDTVVKGIAGYGYLGVFVVGMFFVSTFTVVPAGMVLFQLAKELNPFGLVLFAGAGSMLGDFIIFKFFKDRVFEELKPVFLRLGGSRLSHIFHMPYFAWLGPLLGALIIISPFPDEIGIGLLGISKLKNWQFLLLSFSLNSLGILLLVSFRYIQ